MFRQPRIKTGRRFWDYRFLAEKSSYTRKLVHVKPSIYPQEPNRGQKGPSRLLLKTFSTLRRLSPVRDVRISLKPGSGKETRDISNELKSSPPKDIFSSKLVRPGLVIYFGVFKR